MKIAGGNKMKNVLSDFEKTSFWDHFSKKFAIIHEKTFRHWMFRSLCVISVFVVFGIAVYNITSTDNHVY